MIDLIKQRIANQELFYNHNIGEVQRERYAYALNQLIMDLVIKFIKGNKEHGGGDLRDADLQEEMYNEVLDLAVYHMASRYFPPK